MRSDEFAVFVLDFILFGILSYLSLAITIMLRGNIQNPASDTVSVFDRICRSSGVAFQICYTYRAAVCHIAVSPLHAAVGILFRHISYCFGTLDYLFYHCTLRLRPVYIMIAAGQSKLQRYIGQLAFQIYQRYRCDHVEPERSAGIVVCISVTVKYAQLFGKQGGYSGVIGLRNITVPCKANAAVFFVSFG